MNPRRGMLWWVFWLGAAGVLAALAWASLSVHRLERHNESARAAARRQELIRLALWRVDSQLAPIIATEAARPPGQGVEMDAGERLGMDALTKAPASGEAAGSGEPAGSPTSRRDSPAENVYAKGYFVVEPSRGVAASRAETQVVAEKLSRQAPEPGTAPADAGVGVGAGPVQGPTRYDYAARQRIAQIANSAPARPVDGAPELEQSGAGSALADESESWPVEGPVEGPGERAGADLSARTEVFSGTVVTSAPAMTEPGSGPARVPGPVEARWIDSGLPNDGPSLVLVRTVRLGAGARTEGVELDWDALRSTLVGSIEDLLPGAVLVPARGQAAADLERAGRAFRLATIPALLVPGGEAGGPITAPFRMTPALWALAVTWVAALGALGAVGLVLRATLRLSDRRARFVGAVTHELRTPLTTFRLYAQMLAGGMVPDERVRAEYLGTLERESVRLAEIVENVLEYARLTRRRPGGARPPGERSLSASELLARVRPALSRRAEQSGMDLIVSNELSNDSSVRSGEVRSGRARSVTCDPRSVERILMNLVENACKYAVPGVDDAGTGPNDEPDTRVHLDLGVTDRRLEILVADHGPGIPRRERERVFGEFQRGPQAVESSRPGLGLGLALSRGLAREMGGDLRLVRRRAHGAEFLLTIPLDPPDSAQPTAPA